MVQKHILASARKWTLALGVLLLVLLPLPAVAQAPTIFQPGMEQHIAKIVSFLIGVLNMMTWVIFVFLNFLLDPAFIFDLGNTSGPGLMEILNRIWRLSRDLMNLLFAVILIGAAIYTIVTANKELISQYARKFVLVVVLVNFSWFFPRVIIDAANIATSAIYGIPSLLASSSGAECRFPSSRNDGGLSCVTVGIDQYMCRCRYVTNAEFFLSDADVLARTGAGWTCPLSNIVCIQFQNLDMTSVAGHSAILNGLIVNHARLIGLATIPPTPGASSPGQLMLFIMRESLVLALHIALLFPLAALVLAFAIRIPVLWITIAFMPFMFLQYVVQGNLTGGYPEKLWNYFLKAAFLPAIVAIPLTVGFILVNAGAAAGVSVPGLAGIKISLLNNVSDFWQLLWIVMTLGIFWVGIFSVLEKMELLGAGSRFFKGIGETLGRIAIKAPLAVPILPGGITPLAAVTSVPQGIESQLSGRRGIADVISSMRNGRIPGGPGELEASAAHVGGSERVREELRVQFNRLAETIRNRPEAEARQQLATINTTIRMEAGTNTTDAVRRYEELVGRLERQGVNVTELRTALSSVRQALQQRPPQQNPGGAPPTGTP